MVSDMYGTIYRSSNSEEPHLKFLKLVGLTSFSKRGYCVCSSIGLGVCLLYLQLFMGCSLVILPYRFVLFSSFLLECCYLSFSSSYLLVSSCIIYYAVHSTSCYHFLSLHLFLRSLIWSEVINM